MKIKLSIYLGFFFFFQLPECVFIKAAHPPVWIEEGKFDMKALSLPVYRAALEAQTKEEPVAESSEKAHSDAAQVWGENSLPIVGTNNFCTNEASCHLVTRAAVVSTPFGRDNYYDFVHIVQEGTFSYQEEEAFVKSWGLKAQPVSWDKLGHMRNGNNIRGSWYNFSTLNLKAARAISVLKSAPPTTASDQTIENSISMGISGSVSFAPTGKTGSIAPSFSVANKKTMKIHDISIYNHVGSYRHVADNGDVVDIPKAEWVYKLDNLSRDKNRTNATSISTFQFVHQWVWRINREEAVEEGLYLEKGLDLDLFLVLDSHWGVKLAYPTCVGCYNCCCKCCFSFWCSCCDEVNDDSEPISLNVGQQLPVIIPIPKLSSANHEIAHGRPSVDDPQPVPENNEINRRNAFVF